MNKPASKKKIIIIIVVIAVLIAAAAGGYWYWRSRKNAANSGAKALPGVADKSTNPAKPTETGSTNSNTANQQNTNQKSANLPTPVLIKSAGNNSPAPKDVLIDFTCYAPAGYSCQLELKPKSGTAPSFDKKPLTADSRGQSFANWEWKTVAGSWQAQVVLYNSSGQSKASDPQSFEVK